MGGIGGSAGVILGGILTDALGWRWILFINVPIGIAAALLAQRLISADLATDEEAERNFDLSGAITATAGLSLLVLGIVRTSATGWGAASTLAFIGAGAALLAVFVAIEGRLAKAPLMPLRIYRSRTLTSSNLVVLLLGGATFGMWFFLSLYLQEVRGYSSIRAGLAFLPMTLSIVGGSVLASRLVTRVGAKPLLVVGMVAVTAGLVLFTDLAPHGTYLGDVLVPSLISAIGIGLAFVPATISAVAGVDSDEAGLASGLLNTSRLFGGALGSGRAGHDRHLAHRRRACTTGWPPAPRSPAGSCSPSRSRRRSPSLGVLIGLFGLPPVRPRSRPLAAGVRHRRRLIAGIPRPRQRRSAEAAVCPARGSVTRRLAGAEAVVSPGRSQQRHRQPDDQRRRRAPHDRGGDQPLVEPVGVAHDQ